MLKSTCIHIASSVMLASSICSLMFVTSHDTAFADTVCTNSPIPEGYVIRQTFNSPACGRYSEGIGNAYDIALPSNPFTVCWLSPIPKGWVITQTFNSSGCGYYTNAGIGNAFTIRLPSSSPFTVCIFSPIPEGWVVTQT